MSDNDHDLTVRQRAQLALLPRPQDLFYGEDLFLQAHDEYATRDALRAFDDMMMRQVRVALNGRSTKSFTRPDPNRGGDALNKVAHWRAATVRFLARAGRVTSVTRRTWKPCECCWGPWATASTFRVGFKPLDQP